MKGFGNRIGRSLTGGKDFSSEPVDMDDVKTDVDERLMMTMTMKTTKTKTIHLPNRWPSQT